MRVYHILLLSLQNSFQESNITRANIKSLRPIIKASTECSATSQVMIICEEMILIGALSIMKWFVFNYTRESCDINDLTAQIILGLCHLSYVKLWNHTVNGDLVSVSCSCEMVQTFLIYVFFGPLIYCSSLVLYVGRPKSRYKNN